MKVIICGGRDYELSHSDWTLLNELDDVHHFSEVVVGGAKGADWWGQKWGEAFGKAVKVFRANWKAFGPAAGPHRNQQMADYADAIIAFPGGTGTADMLRRAERKGLTILYRSKS